MFTVTVANADEWRMKAKALLSKKVPPTEVAWVGELEPSLFLTEEVQPAEEITIRVPPRFADLTRFVSCHRDPKRWSILYTLLWRIHNGERRLLEDRAEPTVQRAFRLEQQVKRDIHRIYAFLRFAPTTQEGREVYVAYYEPEHDILELAAPFFMRRFKNMEWQIVTPGKRAVWDTKEIIYREGEKRVGLERDDEYVASWQEYYGATFNPARVNLRKLKGEVPSRFWAAMPEMAKVHSLVKDAPMRVQKMKENQVSDASALIPHEGRLSLKKLKEAAAGCTACPLYQNATQTVFGEGPARAEIMLVGEQPGDEEDMQGHPFIGPAGRLLDDALRDAGIDREKVYVTNAVKHFKWIPRGKRRLHQKPNGAEMSACRPWLDHEVMVVKPKLIVCLGATAAQSMLGRAVKVLSERGTFFPGPHGSTIAITVHPSSILRTPGERERGEALRALVEDLRAAHEELRSNPSS